MQQKPHEIRVFSVVDSEVAFRADAGEVLRGQLPVAGLVPGLRDTPVALNALGVHHVAVHEADGVVKGHVDVRAFVHAPVAGEAVRVHGAPWGNVPLDRAVQSGSGDVWYYDRTDSTPALLEAEHDCLTRGASTAFALAPTPVVRFVGFDLPAQRSQERVRGHCRTEDVERAVRRAVVAAQGPLKAPCAYSELHQTDGHNPLRAGEVGPGEYGARRHREVMVARPAPVVAGHAPDAVVAAAGAGNPVRPADTLKERPSAVLVRQVAAVRVEPERAGTCVDHM